MRGENDKRERGAREKREARERERERERTERDERERDEKESHLSVVSLPFLSSLVSPLLFFSLFSLSLISYLHHSPPALCTIYSLPSIHCPIRRLVKQ
jgi:hypothetical protein